MERFTFQRDQRLVKRELFFGIALILSGILMASDRAASEESSCVSCHTNSRELIKISQIILKKRPPVKSEEIKGEG